jgi:hypothetical protein
VNSNLKEEIRSNFALLFQLGAGKVAPFSSLSSAKTIIFKFLFLIKNEDWSYIIRGLQWRTSLIITSPPVIALCAYCDSNSGDKLCIIQILAGVLYAYNSSSSTLPGRAEFIGAKTLECLAGGKVSSSGLITLRAYRDNAYESPPYIFFGTTKKLWDATNELSSASLTTVALVPPTFTTGASFSPSLNV